MKLKDEFFNEDFTISDKPIKQKIALVINNPLEEARKKYNLKFASLEDVEKYERQQAFYENKFKILYNGNAYIGEISKREHKGNYDLSVKYYSYAGLKQHHIKDEFYTVYDKQVVNKDGKTESQTAYKKNCYQQIWIQKQETKDFEEVVFIPNADCLKPKDLNLWQGFIEPIDGDITPFIQFLEGLIPAENDRQELIKCLAYMVQKPDEPGQRITVFKGDKGTGKTFLVKNIIGRLIPYHFRTMSLDLLCGKWNYLSEHSKVLLADEIKAEKVKEFQDELKMITGNEGTRTLRRRNNDEWQIPNFLTIFATSDNKQAFTIDGENERRLHIIKVSNQYKQNTKYFSGLNKWLVDGGKNHILNYLLNYELADWTPRSVVENNEKDIERRDSLTPIYKKLVDIGNSEFHSSPYKTFEVVNWTDNGLRLDKNYFEKTIELAKTSQTALSRLLNKIFKFDERNGKNWRQNSHGKYVWNSLYEYQQDLAEHLELSVDCLFEGNIEPLPTSNEADELFQDNYEE